MESTYGSSLLYSQHFFPSQTRICLALKKQMRSWEKKTSYVIQVTLNTSKGSFRKIHTIINCNFSSTDKGAAYVGTKLETYLTNPQVKQGMNDHFPDVTRNLVTDSSEITTLPLILFSLCFPSVAQAYANKLFKSLLLNSGPLPVNLVSAW